MLIVAGDAGPNGRPFGRYRLIELLGRGGMGEVWRAHDTETDRIVAIKLLPAHFSENDDFPLRFRREAHAAARLNTPHVIPIHNYGEIAGRLYVDMRLIEGHDLQTVLADGPLEPSRAVRIIEQVAMALHAAHKVGLLHRDVKPSNILLDENDFAYLIDFGIARAADETRLTKSGNTIGTFQYIAPERLDVRTEEDARADIYSLACVLYECLTGRPPFAERTMAALVAAHLNTPPPQPSTAQANVPTQFDPVVARGMAKDPDQRYATTVQLADAARDAITGPIQRLPPGSAPDVSTEVASSPVNAPTVTHDEPLQSPNAFASAPTQRRRGQPPACTGEVASAAPEDHRAGPTVSPRSHTPIPIKEAPAQRLKGRTKVALLTGGVAVVAIVVTVILATVAGPLKLPTSTGYASQVTLPFADLNHPAGVAVGTTGNIYITDTHNSRVLMLAAGSATPSQLPFTGLGKWSDLAVDTSGSVYLTDGDHNRVLKLPAGSETAVELPLTGLNFPSGVAVDNVGNIYVTDDHNSRVLSLPASSTAQAELPFTGLNHPGDVAVDSAGNVYITDSRNNRLLKLVAGAASPTTLLEDLNGPDDVAVDTAGNVYVTDEFNNRVLKLAAGETNATELPFVGLNYPVGVAVDSTGNLYVADKHNNRVLKLPAR